MSLLAWLILAVLFLVACYLIGVCLGVSIWIAVLVARVLGGRGG